MNYVYDAKLLRADGDAHPDIAVANIHTNNVQIFLGHGDGTFTAGAVLGLAGKGTGLAVGDLDGDGRQDLAVTSWYANTLQVFLNGPSGFGSPVTYGTGSGPYFPAIGDLDGDGKDDVVLPEGTTSGAVRVFRGTGGGALASGVTYGSGGQYPFRVSLADLDGDQRLDVVVVGSNSANFTSTVGVLLGTSTGTLATALSTVVQTQVAWGLDVADLDADGRRDVQIASFTGMYVLRNTGGGHLTVMPPTAGGGQPTSFKLADLDGDGHLDQVIADSGVSSVNVVLGTQPSIVLSPGAWPSDFAFGDLDQDGRDDLVIANSGTGATVATLQGTVAGFTAGPALAQQAYSLAEADLDGDGKRDLAMAIPGGVATARGLGDLHFDAPRATTLGGDAYRIAVGDLDGDHKPDAVAAGNMGAVALRNDGTGKFVVLATYAAADGYAQPLLVDLDRDGDLDLVLVNGNRSKLVVLPGNGDGSFGAGVSYADPNGPFLGVVADVNHDGFPDVIGTERGGVGIFPGGTMALGTRIAVSNGMPNSTTNVVAVADVTGDGVPDLAGTAGGMLFVLRGDGTGFTPTGTWLSGTYSLVPRDMDGDGRLDFVGSGAGGLTVLSQVCR